VEPYNKYITLLNSVSHFLLHKPNPIHIPRKELLLTAIYRVIHEEKYLEVNNKSYVRSIKRYCFVRKYAAIPEQLEIFILQYIDWCVLIIWTFIVNQFGCFCQLLLLSLLLLHRDIYVFRSFLPVCAYIFLFCSVL